MARKDHEKHVTGSGSFGNYGSVGSKPVGDGSNAGRPGGRESGHKSPQKSGGRKPEADVSQRFAGGNGPQRSGNVTRSSGGTGIIVALLAWLLLGKKTNGNGTSSNGSSLGKIIRIAIIAVIVIAVLKSCSASSNTYSSYDTASSQQYTQSDYSFSTSQSDSTSSQNYAVSDSSSYNTASSGSYDVSSLLNYGYNNSSVSSGWTYGDNRKTLNTSVASGARSKYYTAKSGNKVNLMIYMIGTDLESSYGMATSDLKEMCNATISDDVNVIIYGGGCKKWNNNAFSSSTNKIYQLKQGGQLVSLGDDGDKVMTDPSTLSGFISFVKKNYSTDDARNILILWDHGGGSISGYGYDERHSSSGSMDLEGIKTALSDGGVKFDFLGFDACLMATTETALMASDYADYLVASEESEPGIGWYYTNWLTMLSSNTAVSTLELGKQICDDFVSQCAQQCSGQSTTLSVTDLAELSKTVPDALAKFSSATTTLISNDGYKQVANARAGSKAFAEGNGIDQVDLIDMAMNLGTDEGKNLANALLSAVKYNNTSSDMANSYGLSVYFPYESSSYVSTAVSTYSDINLSDEYSKCIQTFASYAGGGQSAAYGYSINDLLNSYSSYSSSYSNPYSSSSSSSYSTSDIYSLLESMMSSSSYGRSLNLDTDKAAEYIASNHLNDEDLVWTDGKMILSDEQKSLITEVKLSVYYCREDGRADLGTNFDTSMENEDGSLSGTYDGTWLAINNKVVAFYFMHMFDDGSDNWQITGYVPCRYNGEIARLIIVFDEQHPDGFVSGVVFGYESDENDTKNNTIGKTVTDKMDGTFYFDTGSGSTNDETSSLSAISSGDKIEFLADFYDYDNNYTGTNIINELSVEDGLEVSYVYVVDSGEAEAYYSIKDIYGTVHWSPILENAN